ncbi:hypothetical protein LIZ91_12130 [Enterococcus avium]|jgi:hypothetical protein|uniref:hypothetical protein n=2 Tax=Enterococcus TaxID=1350 RepID=UPI001D089A3D|nr:hypothetical protein [Enterococcus avium]MCB6917347.1 hypothetical protein [Enterococcus avium]MCQ4961058.1 hypothetical protein [Enterococcus avium]MDT2472834.1 hypothetical protein [Enterococcus avium]
MVYEEGFNGGGGMNVDCYGIMTCAGVGKPWKLFPETFTTGKEASAFYVDHLSSEGNLFRIIEINIVSQNMLYH